MTSVVKSTQTNRRSFRVNEEIKFNETETSTSNSKVMEKPFNV